MNWIKGKYQFDLMDLTTLISVLGVVLTLVGIEWASVIFIINCGISILYTIIKVKRINSLVLNISLLVLNGYFLWG